MKIYRRKDGRFLVKVAREDGPGYIQKTFRTEKEAAEFIARMEVPARNGERLTVLECMTRFLESVPHSLPRMNSYLFTVCGSKASPHMEGPAECIADRFVDSLTRADLETVREKARRRGHGTRYVNTQVAYLKTAFRWAASEDLIPETPWEKYKPLKESRQWRRSGDMEELRRLWPELPAYIQWGVRVSMELCLRPGHSELWSLKWDAFNWSKGSVDVMMPKVGRTKTVFPNEEFMKDARERFESRRCEFVCPRRDGTGMAKDPYGVWRLANARAGTRLTMYAVRHIAATEMLAAGVDLASVSQMLGHANPSITARFYIHSDEERMRKASKAIPTLHGIGAEGARKCTEKVIIKGG